MNDLTTLQEAFAIDAEARRLAQEKHRSDLQRLREAAQDDGNDAMVELIDGMLEEVTP